MRQTLRHVRLQAKYRILVRNIRPGGHGIFFLILLWNCCAALASSEDSAATPGGKGRHLAEIVHDLCTRLKLGDRVNIRIDESNDKMVSSSLLPGSDHEYQISFDRRFLEALSDDEIAGAIAHELGHVWIFSHHPYLQTEGLANEIALRVVDRETMTKVYGKLWARTGTPGNIDELLGPDRTQDAAKAATILP